MLRLILHNVGLSLHHSSERLIVKGPRALVQEAGSGSQLEMDLGFKDPSRAVELQALDEPGKPPLFPAADAEVPVVRRKASSRVAAVLLEVPYFKLAELVVASAGVSLSSDVVERLCSEGIPLSFISWNGSFCGGLHGPQLNRTVQTRRAQMGAWVRPEGAEIARRFIYGKLVNQARALKYCAKYQKTKNATIFEELRKAALVLLKAAQAALKSPGADCQSVQAGLMGVEGAAARVYWAAWRTLLPKDIGFSGRSYQAADAVNASLNYGYAILYSRIQAALLLAGLEPYAGFLHTDRPGKSALVYDLAEEFRAPVVDRAVLALFGLGQNMLMENGLLHESSRRLLAERVVARLDSLETYRGTKTVLSEVIKAQARHLAAALRQGSPYRPFFCSW